MFTTVEAYGFGFIIVMALSVAALSFAEYRRTDHRYMRFIAYGLLALSAWHIGNYYLDQLTTIPAIGYIGGNAFLMATALAFLQSQRMLNDKAPSLALTGFLMGLFVVATIAILVETSSVTINIMSVPMILTLVLAAVESFQPKKGAIWIMLTAGYLMAVAGFISGIQYYLPIDRQVGSILYFAFAMTVPVIGVLFYQASTHLSKLQMEVSERNFRDLFNSVRDVFFRIDRNGVIEEISPSVSQFGFDRDELTGRQLSRLFNKPEEFQATLHQYADDPIDRQSVKVRTVNNALLECELSLTQVSDNDVLVGTIRDVDAQKQFERQFLDAQRRESMGLLASGIAHDFNNILQSIVGHTDWMIRTPNMLQEERERHLQVLLDASSTAGLLCRQLLDFTGQSHARKSPVLVHDAIRDVFGIVRHSIPENVNVNSRMIDESLVVKADPTQLRQIVLNLINNAVDAMVDGGLLSVVVHQEYLNDKDLAQVRPPEQNLKAGEYVSIEIIDTGKGIAANLTDRIFEPFYTTKPKGHGLGLAAVLGIVSSHDGGVFVESEAGKGTRFKIILPMSSEMQIAVTSETEDVPRGDGQTVLIADDEREVRLILAALLEDYGYKVIVCVDGADAMARFRRQRDEIDALVLDVKMPHKSGIHLTREIRELDATIPILIASGYTEVPADDSDLDDLGYHFISKPYQQNELLRALAECMREDQ